MSTQPGTLADPRIDVRGATAASITALLYGSSYVATAIALRGFTPLTVVLWRGVTGGLALALLVAAVRSPAFRPARLSRAATTRLLVLATLNGPAFIVSMSVAVSLAGASITAFVAGLYAVLGAVLAVPLLGERLERSTLGALLLALAGAALLGELQLGGDTARGTGVALLAAIAFASFLVLSRRWSTAYELPGPTIALVAMWLSVAVMLAWTAASGVALSAGTPGADALSAGTPGADALSAGTPGADALAAIVWLGLAVSALATTLVVAGMRRLPARRAAAFLLLNPPSAAALSWVLLGERLGPAQLVGAALVLVAIAIASGLRVRVGVGVGA